MLDVLVADDNAVLRTGLIGLISAADDMRLVGMAGDGAEALRALGTTSPQVVLLDLSMPVMDGVAATRRITAGHPGVEVLVLTSLSDQQRVTEALDAGAIGCVLEDTDPGDLLDAIRTAARVTLLWTGGWRGRSCTPVDDRRPVRN